jgi:hypothetical protein
MSYRPALLLLTLAVAMVGCGSAASPAPAPPTLPASAVPYLPSHARTLSPAALARETAAPALRAQLSSWGYMAGADRYFQGESRQLQVVDSRAFRFKSATGARAFVAFVGRHVSVYLGSFPRTRAFSSAGRTGILAIAQPCQCHLANPAYLAVVAGGGTVRWLEINGPGATPRKLARLIAAAP